MNVVTGLALFAACVGLSSCALWLTAARYTLRSSRIVMSHDMSCGVFLLLFLNALAACGAFILLASSYLWRM